MSLSMLLKIVTLLCLHLIFLPVYKENVLSLLLYQPIREWYLAMPSLFFFSVKEWSVEKKKKRVSCWFCWATRIMNLPGRSRGFTGQLQALILPFTDPATTPSHLGGESTCPGGSNKLRIKYQLIAKSRKYNFWVHRFTATAPFVSSLANFIWVPHPKSFLFFFSRLTVTIHETKQKGSKKWN